MPSDLPEIVEDKVMVTCPSCDKSLASPLNYSGKVLCPICDQEFQVGDEDNFEIEIKDQNFWIGLLVPVSIPILISILVSTGIISGNSSPDLMGLMYFMCSLILWPVIGFGIAKSSGTFVKSFRAGARISAIIALVIGGLMWFWFFGFIAGGVTN